MLVEWYFWLIEPKRHILSQRNQVIMNNPIMSVKIPFINSRTIIKPDNSFAELLQNHVCPNFHLPSLTSLLIAICLLVFIIEHILFAPSGYNNFLQHPSQTDKYLLDIDLFKHQKQYFYQLITSMFLHYSYKHIVMNLVFALFVMYELEFCWRGSIVLALLSGFAANCLAVATMNGRVLGFSGVLCACVGVQFAALLIHCEYIRRVYQNQFYIIFFMFLLTLLMIVGLSQGALVHFFGLCYGLLFGLAFYPRMP